MADFIYSIRSFHNETAVTLFRLCAVCVALMVPILIRADSLSGESTLANFVRHASKKSHEPHTFDLADYQTIDANLPIGVFDSGIGGLTVLEAILGLDSFNNETLQPRPDGKPDFADESFIYLGDQANMPYGNYPSLGQEDFLHELILKDTVFLLGRRYWPSTVSTEPKHDKLPVKAIVIACNTATAYGLQDIRKAMEAWQVKIPVIGVVEAGARGVSEQIIDSKERRAVGVLATVGTCGSLAYPKAIAATTGLAGKRPPNVVQQGCVKLAGAIEGEPDAIASCIQQDVRKLVENHQQSGDSRPLDTIVLGCTHFPLVQDQIRDELAQLRKSEVNGSRPFEASIADEVTFVNPAELTAKELFRELARHRLQRPSATMSASAETKSQFYLSVPAPTLDRDQITADGGLTQEYKYGRASGKLAVEDTRYVPMTLKLLPASSLTLIEKRLPHVWHNLSLETR